MRRLLVVRVLLVGGVGGVLAGCGGGDGHHEFGEACREVRQMSQMTDDPAAYAEHLRAAQRQASSAIHLNPDWNAARDLLDVLSSGGVSPEAQAATATEMCGRE